MNSAAPQELARIMGSPITRTRAQASAKGRATARMMAICTTSASSMVSPAVSGLRARSWEAERRRTRPARPPMRPSTVVERPQARAVKPPREYRCRPLTSPTPRPRAGPPMSPASTGPLARALAMAPCTFTPM